MHGFWSKRITSRNKNENIVHSKQQQKRSITYHCIHMHTNTFNWEQPLHNSTNGKISIAIFLWAIILQFSNIYGVAKMQLRNASPIFMCPHHDTCELKLFGYSLAAAIDFIFLALATVASPKDSYCFDVFQNNQIFSLKVRVFLFDLERIFLFSKNQISIPTLVNRR